MGEPISLSFNDRYFYKQDGLGESSYVFINGNDLTKRWKRLKKHESFNIGELGFGTGLNFLNVLKNGKLSEKSKAQLYLHRKVSSYFERFRKSFSKFP